MAEAYFGEGGKHRKYHRVSHTATGRRHKGAEGEGFFDDFKKGFKSVFDPIGRPLVSLLPGGSFVNKALDVAGLGDGMRLHHRRSAGEGRRRLHSRLAHHELGFQGMGDSSGDLADLHYFEGSGRRRHHRRGAEGDAYHLMRLGADADGEGHTGGRRRRHRRGADADGDAYHLMRLGADADGEGHTGGRRRRHRRGADADGEGHTGGRRHRRGADADGDAYHRHRRGAEGEGRRKRKPSARNMLVKKVMMERGVSLPEASRIVKQEGLY